MRKTIGGDRLGSGKKMKVDLKSYERSTHDLGYVFRTTQAAGTLIPFMNEVALPGDTFDIDLDVLGMTHPTVGPLFGSYKYQLDVFLTPIRLYNALLHNNALGIGNDIAQVKLPQTQVIAYGSSLESPDIDNAQINASCIYSYLGIRGIGSWDYSELAGTTRDFNAVPLLGYWDIYKNYYANKQEELGAVIHSVPTEPLKLITSMEFQEIDLDWKPVTESVSPTAIVLGAGSKAKVYFGVNGFDPSQIYIINTRNSNQIREVLLSELFNFPTTFTSGEEADYNAGTWGSTSWDSFRYLAASERANGKPNVVTFPLEDIDRMREEILGFTSRTTPFNLYPKVVNEGILPYKFLFEWDGDGQRTSIQNTQEGLGVKTYQSDIFNNWIDTEWIDGPSGVAAVTAVDTSGGSFTIDTLNLSKKVYDMLNRVAIAGGSYKDWQEVTYDHMVSMQAEVPIFVGGLSRELIFQEVVNTSGTVDQPLGTLAGQGKMSQGKKGGRVTVKVDEPSYIQGILSLTPRIDYSQGNRWDSNLKTLADLHMPAMDEIGFQDLVTEQMHWADTYLDLGEWKHRSAGKQPAWINYMTNYNRTYGNFAVETNEMFMTLNRRYELENVGSDGIKKIKDLTTYIDPSKYNFIFAETAIDAQNFWTQISVDITARRKMSAKIMPNL